MPDRAASEAPLGSIPIQDCGNVIFVVDQQIVRMEIAVGQGK